ncbi:MAG: helix-turn-helix transcriptional regulator [Myxococcaceae bacterium]
MSPVPKKSRRKSPRRPPKKSLRPSPQAVPASLKPDPAALAALGVYLKRPEVCALLGVHRDLLRRLTRAGAFPSPVQFDPKAHPRWLREDVLRWMAERAATSRHPAWAPRTANAAA